MAIDPEIGTNTNLRPPPPLASTWLAAHSQLLEGSKSPRDAAK